MPRPSEDQRPGGIRVSTDAYAFEDLVGAGAIAAALPGSRSPEAEAAVAAFEAAANGLEGALMACSSGRELVEMGYTEDVRMAAELDVETVAAELVDGRYVAREPR